MLDGEERTALFRDVYLAVGDGEFTRDQPIDPVETYTKPQAAKIVARLAKQMNR